MLSPLRRARSRAVLPQAVWMCRTSSRARKAAACCAGACVGSVLVRDMSVRTAGRSAFADHQGSGRAFPSCAGEGVSARAAAAAPAAAAARYGAGSLSGRINGAVLSSSSDLRRLCRSSAGGARVMGSGRSGVGSVGGGTSTSLGTQSPGATASTSSGVRMSSLTPRPSRISSKNRSSWTSAIGSSGKGRRWAVAARRRRASP